MSPVKLGPEILNEEVTVDGALGNHVQFVQPAAGYRFSIDAILLARFAAEYRHERVLDLGCGCGVVGLGILALTGRTSVVGIDCQQEMIECAEASAARNGLEQRAKFFLQDLRQIRGAISAGEFDLVVSNPPFRPVGSGRMSPNQSVAIARHELLCCIGDVAGAAGYVLARGGAFCVVYPAERLAPLVDACLKEGLQPKVLRFIHPRSEEGARLVLLRCVKGGGENLVVRSPLVLHGPGGDYSEEASTLLGSP